jgi:hypothetical protein
MREEGIEHQRFNAFFPPRIIAVRNEKYNGKLEV